ncbi:putative leader peptide [Blastococcus sp. SYSU D00695]
MRRREGVLLVGRPHLDLVRYAGALCPGR